MEKKQLDELSKKPVANQDLWVLLDNINEQLHIEWNWVKGHETNLYNNLADKYAVEAMKNQRGVILKNGETTDILKYFGHTETSNTPTFPTKKCSTTQSSEPWQTSNTLCP